MVMNAVIKALSSKSLPASRRQFQLVAREMFLRLVHLFRLAFQQFLSTGDVHMGSLSILLVKCIRRCLTFGFKELSSIVEVDMFMEQVHGGMQQLLSIYLSGSCSNAESVGRMLTQIGKLVLNLQDSHSSDFYSLPASIKVVTTYHQVLKQIQGREEMARFGELPLLEKLVLQTLLILRGAVKHHSIFNDTDFQEMGQLVVLHYLCFTTSDLQELVAEPEKWMQEDEADAWEFFVRPCAEKLFMDLIAFKPNLFLPWLRSSLMAMSQSKSRPRDLLVKESIYAAIGISAHWSFESFPFDEWLQQTLVPEVQLYSSQSSSPLPSSPLPLSSESSISSSSSSPSSLESALLLRRISLVLGQWVGVKCSPSSRPLVYQILVHLMDHSYWIVSFTAAQNLQFAVDDWEFQPEPFLPYLDPSLTKLVAMMSSDTLMVEQRILNVLSVIAERMIQYFGERQARWITDALPSLWMSAASLEEGGSMLQGSIVNLLCKLVAILSGQPFLVQLLSELLIPILNVGLDTRRSESVYLLEDCLLLWKSVMQSVDERHLDLDNPSTRHLFSLMEFIYHPEHGLLFWSSDQLDIVLGIVENAVLLAPDLVLEHHLNGIAAGIEKLLDLPVDSVHWKFTLRPQAVTKVCSLLSICMLLLVTPGDPNSRPPSPSISSRITPFSFEGTPLLFLLRSFVWILILHRKEKV